MMETQSATQMSSSVKMATSTADCASHPEASRRLTFMAAATSIVASGERETTYGAGEAALSPPASMAN